jgi:hypothetical protein
MSVYIYSVCVVQYVGRGLAKGWSPIQGVLLTLYRIRELQRMAKAQQNGCRAINNWINGRKNAWMVCSKYVLIYYEGQSRSSRNSLTLTFGAAWVRTARTVSLVISMCKFCRGCAMQLKEEARQVAGRDSGFCITITHGVTHSLLCQHQISLRVTSGCSLLWEWASRGHVSQPWRAANGMRQLNSGRLKKNQSAGASNSGRIDGARVYVCARVLLWRWLGEHYHMFYHYSATSPFRELIDCPSYIFPQIWWVMWGYWDKKMNIYANL